MQKFNALWKMEDGWSNYEEIILMLVHYHVITGEATSTLCYTKSNNNAIQGWKKHPGMALIRQTV